MQNIEMTKYRIIITEAMASNLGMELAEHLQSAYLGEIGVNKSFLENDNTQKRINIMDPSQRCQVPQSFCFPKKTTEND